MATMDDTQDPAAGDWWAQNAPPASPSWLPAGATINADGSITLSNGSTLAAPPPGYARDPNTGVISYTGAGGAPMWSDPAAPPIVPGQDYTPTAESSQQWSAQPAAATASTSTTGSGSGGGGTAAGAGATAPIGVPTSGFGAAPSPYGSDPNAPQFQPLPEYRAPQWTGGDYVAPTQADLEASPGYGSRLARLMKTSGRQFAAQGTVLNGGTLDALDRRAQDYASGEYQNLRANTFEAYKNRYAQFSDTAGRDLASRSLAATDNQNTFLNRTSTYLSNNNRTLSDYLTNLTAKRNSELDYWNRLQDLNSTGASTASGSR
jgi:hypothetical protein